MYEQILFPFDHSPRSLQAATVAVDLARRYKARLVVMHAIAPYSAHAAGSIRRTPDAMGAEEYRKRADRKALAALDKIAAAAKEARVPCETLVVHDADAAEAIVDTAKSRKSDLIVMASSGRTGIERLFLGSVTSEVLEKAKAPVLVCR
jgi:nucleotide-binding universal stress UspA family protein